MPSLTAKMKIFPKLAKNYWKIETELFLYGAISFENQTLSQIFFEWLETVKKVEIYHSCYFFKGGNELSNVFCLFQVNLWKSKCIQVTLSFPGEDFFKIFSRYFVQFPTSSKNVFKLDFFMKVSPLSYLFFNLFFALST